MQEFNERTAHGFNNPDVLAAQLELDNTISQIILSSSQEVQIHLRNLMNREPKYSPEILKGMINNAASCPLLQQALVRHAIHGTAVQKEPEAVESIITLAATIDADLTLVALDCVSQVYDLLSSETTKETYHPIFDAYLAALQNSSSAQVHAVALTRCAEMLDDWLKMYNEPNREMRDAIQSACASLPDREKSPDKSNAEIRISGWLIIHDLA